MSYQARAYLRVGLGTAILAFGTSAFILPYEIVAGGTSGMAVILSKLTPIIGAQGWVAILSVSLFLIGALLLGFEFASRTLASATVYPILVSLFSHLIPFDLFTAEDAVLSPLFAAVIGGGLVGAGCATVFMSGGSTGGTDVLAFIISKCFPRVRVANAVFITDLLIILLGFAASGSFAAFSLGLSAALACALAIDRVLFGLSGALSAEIVTTSSDDILQRIIDELGRTATIISARGGFSGEGRSVVKLTLEKREYSRLLHLVRECDPSAFITVFRAYEIKGEGWESIAATPRK